MRRSQSLDGPWRFGTSRAPDRRDVHFDREIEIPRYPQQTFERLPEEPLYFWYQREIELGAAPPGHRQVLRIGAADYLTDVWLNDRKLGSNRGGYLPFELELPPDLEQQSRLTVRVWDAPSGAPSNDPSRPDPRWIPRGKQGWYGECSGIWQPVSIETRPRNHVTAVRSEALEGNAGAQIQVWVSGDGPAEIQLDILEPGSEHSLWRGHASSRPGEAYAVDARGFDFAAWTPEHPALYRVRTRLVADEIEDVQDVITGFRRVRSDREGLWLNDIPLYLRGALDQDYTPLAGHAYPGDEALEARMRAAKQAGLNLLRCHVKLPDPRYLALADRIGLLVWYELPSWGYPDRPEGALPDELDAEVQAMLRRSARRDAHHPSLIARSIVNEGWGLDLAGSAEDRDALRSWTRLAREVDPTRLVIDNSAMPDRSHVDTDLADFHTYAAHPQGDGAFEKVVARLATRPPEIWSREDAQAPGDRPVALTEFGLWGLPATHRLPGRGLYARRRRAGTTDAHDVNGFAERFEGSPSRSAFESTDDLARATRELQAEGLRRQIGRVRATAGLSGFVVTEMSDQTWEANGLLEFDGTAKPALDMVRSVAAPRAVLVDGLATSCWAGEDLTCRVLLTGAVQECDARLEWRLGDEPRGTRAVNIASGVEPREIACLRFAAPLIEVPQWIELHIRIEVANQVLAQRERVLVLPDSHRAIDGKLRVLVSGVSEVDQVGTLANALAEAGCTTLTHPTRTAAVVSVGGDARAREQIEAGTPGLILAEAHDTPVLPSIARRGPFAPHWCTAFDWIRPGLLGDLPVGPLMDAAFTRCAARRVIPAIDGLATDDVLMGTFRGWLGDEAAITAQARYGDGKVVVTTLRLAEAGRADPLSRAILVALLQYVVSDVCDPVTQIH